MKAILIALLFVSSLASSQSAEMRRTLVAAESRIEWMANYQLGNGHAGRFDGISGFITTKNGAYANGDITIDMNTIVVTDIKDAKGRKNLENHLKNEDFFEADRYPKATFKITSITQAPAVNGINKYYNVSGLLQIKDRINIVKFIAAIEQSNNRIHAVGEFTIDRTKWNVMFQSKSVLADLKNGFISDEMKVKFDLVFK